MDTEHDRNISTTIVRHHYIRDKLKNKTIDLEYIPTEEMIADSLTKAVRSPKNIFCGMGIKN